MRKRVVVALITGCMLIGTVAYPATTMNVWAEENSNQGVEADFSYRELANGTIEITRCSQDVVKVVIPSEVDGKTVTSIGDDAFDFCKNLTDITIPETITNIGMRAFYDCTSLKNIEIPASVTNVGEEAFFGCSNMESIQVAENSTSLASEDGCLYTKDKTAFLAGPGGKTEIKIPAETLYIVEDSLRGCTKLKKITVAENSASFMAEDGVLYSKDKTEIVRCPGGRTGEFAIPEGVLRIGRNAFMDCIYLEHIEIPMGVETIGWYAFNGCKSIKDIEIPESVRSLAGDTFWDCSSLVSIHIPKNTFFGSQHIEDFLYCESLQSITVDENHPMYASVDGILYNKDKTELLCCPGGKTGTVEVLDGVTKIGDYAFFDCKSVTNVKLPEGVTTIGNQVFYYCESIEYMELPRSVTSIGYGAFNFCNSLRFCCFKSSEKCKPTVRKSRNYYK